MACLYITTDLFFSSRVTSLARDRQLEVRVVPTVAAAGQLLAEGDFQVAILDLTAIKSDLAAAVSQLKQTAPDLHVIAYGPHVDEALLSSAQQAGCDDVMPRSRFDQEIVSLLAEKMTKSQ